MNLERPSFFWPITRQFVTFCLEILSVKFLYLHSAKVYVFCALTILLILLFQAIRATVRWSGSSEKTIRNVIKEKLYFGDFVGRPYPKYKKSIFEKLTTEQKDAIRKAVIDI